MSLKEKGVGNDCSKPAQRRDEPQLAQLFAEVEIKFDAVEMFLSMKRRQVAFNWQFKYPEPDYYRENHGGPHHNSFP
jgi:hypothetical protein